MLQLFHGIILSALGLWLIAYAIEIAAFLGFWRWYYCLGPAFHRERWQTAGSPDQVVTALSEATSAMKLSSRRRGDCILLRPRWFDLSAWPRICLRVSESPHGAALIYEVRPFIGMALIIIILLMAFASGFMRLFNVGMIVLIMFIYLVMWWFEMRRFARLAALRERLKHLGLSVCSKCGYDRFGLSAVATCPECGYVPEPPPPQPSPVQ